MISRRSFFAGSAAMGVATAIPGISTARAGWTLPEAHKPRVVTLSNPFPAGEIHVDPTKFALFWTLEGGRALRYTVGIGRNDLYERGRFTIGAKKKWPSWTPTEDMIEREPEKYEQFKDGLPGGPGNPLGSRALYLFTRARGDTFLRIHGTSEPWTLARAVSNGCVRLTNAHIAHLYSRVPLGTKVFLY